MITIDSVKKIKENNIDFIDSIVMGDFKCTMFEEDGFLYFPILISGTENNVQYKKVIYYKVPKGAK